MKIALFSDIHANLPALQAVLDDVDHGKPDFVFCLGDLVGYNIWPNEVIHEIRNRHIPVIAGNYDYGIGLHSDDCGCAYKTDEEREMGAVSISYTNEVTGDEQRSYLRSLPAHLRLEYKAADRQGDLLLVHGSPRKINEYLFEVRDEKSLRRIMQNAGADILCFGHTHKPYHRILEPVEAGDQQFRHAINIGSVGKPKDGDHRACYVILTIHEPMDLKNKDGIEVEFVRVEYDIEKAARAIEESILPDEYAAMLRQAR